MRSFFANLCLLAAWPTGASAQVERLEVEGVGRTDEDARDSAMRRALDAYSAYLRTREPPILAYAPSLESVQALVVPEQSTPGTPIETPDGTFARTWNVRVTLPSLTTLRQWDNQAERGRSAFFAALAAISLVGLLTGVCWYCERRTPQRDAV